MNIAFQTEQIDWLVLFLLTYRFAEHFVPVDFVQLLVVVGHTSRPNPVDRLFQKFHLKHGPVNQETCDVDQTLLHHRHSH